jgi:hypothetical protein
MKQINNYVNEKLSLNDKSKISTKLLKWGKAQWSVSVVDTQTNKIDTYLFKSSNEINKFFEKAEPEYYTHCEGGPTIEDQISDIDGQDNGGCLQFCYDNETWKYYIVSYISML